MLLNSLCKGWRRFFLRADLGLVSTVGYNRLTLLILLMMEEIKPLLGWQKSISVSLVYFLEMLNWLS
jgi:hypothetical protein